MKKLFLVLAVAAGFISCERETVIVVEGDECENCQGASIILSPQTKGAVDRGDIYAWVDVITVVATDDQGVDYGDVFQLVDDGSGADGFYLNSVPTNEEIDFSASTTSVTSTDNGQYLGTIADPNETLESLEAKLVFAEYATDAPVTEQITNGENIVTLQMNTDHGRIISSFQLDSRFDDVDGQGNPFHKIVVTRGSETMEAGGQARVTNYWNDSNSVAGATQTYNIELIRIQDGAVEFQRTITETVLASKSVTNKYVVGLGIALSSSVEVVFSWQAWEEIDGTDETLSPNGLDCSSCGAVTNMNFPGSHSLSGDSVWEDVNLVIAGDLNLNGHTLTVTCGSVTVSGNFNGGGTIIVAGDLVVTGATQNNPTINANECF